MLKLCGKVILNVLHNNNKMGKIINIVQFKYQSLYITIKAFKYNFIVLLKMIKYCLKPYSLE